MATLGELRGQRQALNEQAQAMQRQADDEGRALTDEEKGALDRLMTRFDELGAEMGRRERLQSQDEKMGARGPASSTPQPTPGAVGTGGGARSHAGGPSAADVSRAASTLLALGVIEAVFAVLAIATGEWLSVLVNGALGACTIVFGSMAARQGRIETARAMSLVAAIIFAIFAILLMALALSAGVFGDVLMVFFVVEWAFVAGYVHAYRRLGGSMGRRT